MEGMRVCLAATVVSVALASVAFAGVANSPVPLLSGEKAFHVFSVPGVRSGADLETLFMCTNLDTKTIRVAVELFGFIGGNPLNDVTAGNGVDSNVGVGHTTTLGTGDASAFSEDDVATGLASLDQGSARIISTSKRIMCTAIVTEAPSSPPVSMVNLQVIPKLKQRGD